MLKSKIKMAIIGNGVFLSFFMISTPSICNASEYEKNGLPCVKEICIGDGVSELAKINWNKVDVKPNPKDVLYSSNIKERDKKAHDYIGNTKNLADNIFALKFDSSTISHLNEVTANCNGGRTFQLMEGTYKTKDGNLTKVKIELIPDQQNHENLTQSWVVTQITRKLNISSEQQRQEATKEMNSRYSFVNEVPFAKRTSHFSFGFDIIGNNDVLDLMRVDYGTPSTIDRASIHPGCPGASKAKFD